MFKKLWSKVTAKRIGVALLILAMLATVVVQQAPRLSNVHLKDMFTIGTVESAGVADATCDGVADDVQAQALVTALPANGGRVYILTGTYVWANATTVTDASPNITIEGTGAGTYFTGDGVTAQFTAGANGWTFKDFRTNVTTSTLLIAMGATTGWSWENITTADGYFAYRTDDATTASSWNIPTGRTATYVIAASNAPALSKSQADIICDSTADDVQIQAAIDAGYKDIKLMGQTFNIATGLVINNIAGLHIEGQGDRSTTLVPQGDIDIITIKNTVPNSTFNITLEKFGFADPTNKQTTKRCIYLNTNALNTLYHITIRDMYFSNPFKGICTDTSFTDQATQVTQFCFLI